jgi:hypothetical protein
LRLGMQIERGRQREHEDSPGPHLDPAVKNWRLHEFPCLIRW